MKATIENLTIESTGLSREAHADLEQSATRFAQAVIDEDAARDRETLKGIAEFEAGNFITIDEWAEEMRVLSEELAEKSDT